MSYKDFAVAPPKVSSEFEFEEGGRTYSCCIEGPAAKGTADAWWWFSVSSAIDRQRYAPFRVEPGDTPTKVRPRIVAWYEAMLEKRAAPSVPHWRRERPQPAAAPAATAAPPPPAAAK